MGNQNNRIVGNTLHFIDEKADLGKIISHKITPIFQKILINNLQEGTIKMKSIC